MVWPQDPERLMKTLSALLLEEAPVLPVHDYVLFPHAVAPLLVGRPGSVAAVEFAMESEGNWLLVLTQKPGTSVDQDPRARDMYRVGTLARILQVDQPPDSPYRVLVQGHLRVNITRLSRREGILWASFTPFPIRKNVEEVKATALLRRLREGLQRALDLGKQLPSQLVDRLMETQDLEEFGFLLAWTLSVSVESRQALLEIADLDAFLHRLRVEQERELDILAVEAEIEEQVRQEMAHSQREYILRERLKAIQEELGMMDEHTEDILQLRRQIEASGMPKEVKEKALREVSRLEKMPPTVPEVTVVRTYLDWLIAMPWDKKTEDKVDIKRAREILDSEHYGLEHVKERVLEFLAVRKLTPKTKGPILCFVGPPGVGKTSVGRSIAEAMGRKFIRISLGGIRDEAEIRGHRRTYIGAMPGRIIQAMRQVGVKNPVFMMDEVDKLGVDFRGDPSAALLEALDPEQNKEFSDHYLEVSFDLSDVMFLLTANVLDTVPPALRDRMEVIEFPGYTEEDKVEIALRFLLPKQMEGHGLRPNAFRLTEEAVRRIIREYTREAGVRNLERSIAAICRKIARRIAEGERHLKVIRPSHLEDFLGLPKFSPGLEKEAEDMVGLANGLAYTPAGGVLLPVEVTLMPGKGNLLLTGLMGEVMKESAQAALSYARSRSEQWGLPRDYFEKVDIHIHVPEGATPKEGPSAGIAIAVALVSALRGVPVRHDVGMTGEITLRGRVLAVGGIKEKMLAAHRVGLREVILPVDNQRDLDELPPKVKRELTFHHVKHLDEALRLALRIPKTVEAGTAQMVPVAVS